MISWVYQKKIKALEKELKKAKLRLKEYGARIAVDRTEDEDIQVSMLLSDYCLRFSEYPEKIIDEGLFRMKQQIIAFLYKQGG